MRKLVLKSTLPYPLELKLIQRYGYEVDDRNYRESITFVKQGSKQRKDPYTFKGMLSIGREIELARQCDNIVSHYPDPYKAIGPIRLRLHNMAQSLRYVAEREFVLDYIEDNFPKSLQDEKKGVA